MNKPKVASFIEVFQGKNIRSIKVQTMKGVLIRMAMKLAMLDIHVEQKH